MAFEEPRLKPTVPYALTISKMTLKMLNHGSSALPIIRVRCLVSLTFRFIYLGTYFDDTDEPEREGEPPHVESELTSGAE